MLRLMNDNRDINRDLMHLDIQNLRISQSSQSSISNSDASLSDELLLQSIYEGADQKKVPHASETNQSKLANGTKAKPFQRVFLDIEGNVESFSRN